MNKEEVNTKLLNDVTELSASIETRISLESDSIKIITKYEELLFDIYSYWWMKLNPSTFFTCYLTGDDYNHVNHTKYGWYIKMKNGSFRDCLVKNNLTDYDLYINGHDSTYKKRYDFVEKMFYYPDFENDFGVFLNWCILNINTD